MKYLIFIFFFSLLVFPKFGLAQFGTQHADTIQTGPPGNGYPNSYLWALIQTPLDSASPTYHNHAHPLIVFGHGDGQQGSGEAGLMNLVTSADACIPYDIAHGTLRMAFLDPITGDSVYPICITPQQNTASDWGVYGYQLDSLIGDCIHHKFAGIIDSDRVYITGLSAGGEMAWDFVGHWNPNTAGIYIPRYKAAAIAIMSAVIDFNTTNGEGQGGFKYLISDSVRLWGFGDSSNVGNDIHGLQTAWAVDSVHHFDGGIAAYLAQIYTQFPPGTGHGGWAPYYLPTYVDANNGKSVYTWLLQYVRGVVPPPTPVVSVNAGSNQTLSPGTTTATLTGSATTNVGSIVRYEWTQTAGPTVGMSNQFAASTGISGLSNGDTYTFQLLAVNTDSTEGTGSTNVTVSNIVGTRIYVNPNNIWYNSSLTVDTSFLELNSLTRDSVEYKLYDEQHLVDPQSNPLLVPVTYPSVSVNPQEFYPLQSVVDFGGYYQLTNIDFYSMFGTGPISIYTGYEGNWTLYFSGSLDSYMSWVFLNSSEPITRFVKVVLGSNQTNVGEICYYGTLQGSLLPTTMSHPVAYTYPTFNNMMGVDQDGQPFIPPTMLQGLGINGRGFENQVWMDTNSYHHAIDSLKFNFDIYSDTWSLTHYYWPTFAAGEKSYAFPLNAFVNSFTLSDSIGQTNLWYSMQGWPNALNGYNGWNGYFPIDSINHPGYRDSSIASNYDRQARMSYLYGRVLGNGIGTSGTSQITYPTSGYNLNRTKWVEDGNELNSDGVTPFWTAAGYEAYSSEFYDGNGSDTASHLGFINADPALKHMNAGYYYLDSQTVKGIKYFSYWRRPDHKWIWDGINVHYYPFNSPDHDTSQALSPEADSTRSKFTTFVNWCHKVQPGVPVILSEFSAGDRNRSSPLHVPIVTGVDSATEQAILTTRFEFAIAASGISFSTLFQLQNDPQSNPTFPNVNPLDTFALYLFNSTGLNGMFQSPVDFSIQYLATPSYYYTRSLNSLMGNYRFDSIISESSNSAWEYRFRNTSISDSVILAVWSPTITNATISNYVVHVGNPLQSISLVQFINGSTTGTVTSGTTDGSGNYTMNVTENPTFILTTGSTILPSNYIIHKRGYKIFWQ